MAPLVPVKISLASRLYTGKRTLAQSCIFEHQQYQMKPFSLPPSTPHLQAWPTLLPPSSSPLQLYIEPSPFLHIGRVSKWGRRATGRTQYICTPLCILGKSLRLLASPKARRNVCLLLFHLSTGSWQERKNKTDLDGLDADDLECIGQPHPQLTHPRPPPSFALDICATRSPRPALASP